VLRSANIIDSARFTIIVIFRNGKVEHSHRSDEQEFYQLLSYKGDVDLEAKLDQWEQFYNLHRPHGAHQGKTPYEALREKLQATNRSSRE